MSRHLSVEFDFGYNGTCAIARGLGLPEPIIPVAEDYCAVMGWEQAKPWVELWDKIGRSESFAKGYTHSQYLCIFAVGRAVTKAGSDWSWAHKDTEDQRPDGGRTYEEIFEQEGLKIIWG